MLLTVKKCCKSQNSPNHYFPNNFMAELRQLSSHCSPVGAVNNVQLMKALLVRSLKKFVFIQLHFLIDHLWRF